MIGVLINKFDDLPWEEQTVQTFEQLFKVSLPFKKEELLEIKGLYKGYTREIKVGSTLFKVELKPDYNTNVYLTKKIKGMPREKKYTSCPKKIGFYVDGKLERVFDSISQAKRILGIHPKTIRVSINKNVTVKRLYRFKIMEQEHGKNNQV